MLGNRYNPYTTRGSPQHWPANLPLPTLRGVRRLVEDGEACVLPWGDPEPVVRGNQQALIPLLFCGARTAGLCVGAQAGRKRG